MTTTPAFNAWFCDMAHGRGKMIYPAGSAPFVPCNPLVAIHTGTSGGGLTAIKLFGFWNLVGKTVSAFICGLDCGDFTVASDGSVTVPYGSDPQGQLTFGYINGIATVGTDYGENTVTLAGQLLTDTHAFTSTPSQTIPAVIGFAFLTQGQGLRPATAADLKSPTGDGLAKLRRVQGAGVLFQQAGPTELGVTFDATVNTTFTTADGYTILTLPALFSGVWEMKIEGTDTFDGMVCWQIDRPWPCTVCSVNSFLHSSDR